jgi:hypothetical protein
MFLLSTKLRNLAAIHFAFIHAERFLPLYLYHLFKWDIVYQRKLEVPHVLLELVFFFFFSSAAAATDSSPSSLNTSFTTNNRF